MAHLHLDLIPVYVIAAGAVALLLRRSPVMLTEGQLAVVAALFALGLSLVACDAASGGRMWSGEGWIALAGGVGVGVGVATAILVGRTVRAWVLLRMPLHVVLAALEKALQGVRFEYQVTPTPPRVVLSNPDATLTVRAIGDQLLVVTFRGSESAPKLRLFKKVARKFLLQRR